MDNPALSLLHQEDFSELLGKLRGGAGTGDRLPLIVYRVYPVPGREEMMRGSRHHRIELPRAAESCRNRQR